MLCVCAYGYFKQFHLRAKFCARSFNFAASLSNASFYNTRDKLRYRPSTSTLRLIISRAFPPLPHIYLPTHTFITYTLMNTLECFIYAPTSNAVFFFSPLYSRSLARVCALLLRFARGPAYENRNSLNLVLCIYGAGVYICVYTCECASACFSINELLSHTAIYTHSLRDMIIIICEFSLINKILKCANIN